MHFDWKHKYETLDESSKKSQKEYDNKIKQFEMYVNKMKNNKLIY